jgi:hypothetical protein
VRTYITVKTDAVGYHRWADAPDDYSYLRNLHRHKFYVEATIEVTHDDREIEFFAFQEFVSDTLSNFLVGCAPETSCEMMARHMVECIGQTFGTNRVIRVSVSEDGECSALCEEMPT